jgi:hypothetical protein
MECRTYQVRIFVQGHQVTTATCPSHLWPPKIGDLINDKWQVLKVEPKPNSGEFTPPPLDGEVWVEAVEVPQKIIL